MTEARKAQWGGIVTSSFPDKFPLESEIWLILVIFSL